MREGMGLYKAKRIDNGEWVEGNLLASKDGTPDRDFAEILVKDKHGYVVMWHEVDMETIGQWTGLVDKNGVKIFEGDILKPSFDDKWKCLVQFNEGAFGIKYMAIYSTFCDFYGSDAKFEVIGNIHDKAVEE